MVSNNKFIVMWCSTGLECVIDVSEVESDAFIAGLSGKQYSVPFNLGTLILRARANSQRHYEIYAVETDAAISKQQLESLFSTNPQHIVNLIRANGHQIYSDRVDITKQKIV